MTELLAAQGLPPALFVLLLVLGLAAYCVLTALEAGER